MKSRLIEACAQSARLLLLCAAVTGPSSSLAAPALTALEVRNAWVRANPPGTPVAAGYLSLHNRSSKDVRVIGLRSPLADHVEVHEMKSDSGQMKMRRLDELKIPAGQTVQLIPGGLHLMFFGTKGQVVAGDSVAVTLSLDDGSQLALDLPVRQAAPEADAHSHHH